MKKNIALAFTVILLALLTTASSLFGQKGLGMAPDFKLLDTYQNVHRLSDYRGKQPVLLFFWATWCPFCQKELSTLNQSYAGLSEDGLEVLAIDVGERPSDVESFIKSYYLSFQVLLDQDQSVASSYKLVGIPVYVLIDKEGRIVFEDSYLPYTEYKNLISDSKPKP